MQLLNEIYRSPNTWVLGRGKGWGKIEPLLMQSLGRSSSKSPFYLRGQKQQNQDPSARAMGRGWDITSSPGTKLQKKQRLSLAYTCDIRSSKISPMTLQNHAWEISARAMVWRHNCAPHAPNGGNSSRTHRGTQMAVPWSCC